MIQIQHKEYMPIDYSYGPPLLAGLGQTERERKPWHVLLPFVAAFGVGIVAIAWMERPRRRRA